LAGVRDELAREREILKAEAREANATIEKDRRIESLQALLDEKQAEIAKLIEPAAQMEGRIAELVQSVSSQAAVNDGRIESLQAVLDEKQAEIAKLTETAAKNDGQIESLQALLDERKAEIASLAQTTAEQEGKSRGLRNRSPLVTPWFHR
jgi:chromosome segregation ATPase